MNKWKLNIYIERDAILDTFEYLNVNSYPV